MTDKGTQKFDDPLQQAMLGGTLGGGKVKKSAQPVPAKGSEAPRTNVHRMDDSAKVKKYPRTIYLSADEIGYLKHLSVDRSLEKERAVSISDLVEEAIKEYRQRHSK
jgi:hypothetical protein